MREMSELAAIPLQDRPMPFLFRYISVRPWLFGGLLLVVVGAAACAVGVQYGMKLIVDAMTVGERQAAAVWGPLALFMGLIAAESGLWRLGGLLGCRAVVWTSVAIRLDLFSHLTGHAMRYFADHFSGSLGNRISQTAQSTQTILSTLTWNVLPPVVDFLGAVLVLTTIDWRMALALVAFVAVVAAMILLFGARGRPLHQRYAEESARANGELVDVVQNVWTVKAFSARIRERDRLAREFQSESDAHRASWMYVEKTRVFHDVALWIMAGSMLAWAILAWRAHNITPGDVVVISALTFRILHGSRDLAFALVGMSQHFGAIAETLRVIAKPHDVLDPPEGRALVPAGGEVVLEEVDYRYPSGRPLFRDLSLRIPAGQRVGLVGPSGAGKTTLVALIQRLDDVQHGRILIDGQPITEVSQDSLRERIAVVPQDIALFHRSVIDNIRYGRPEASDEEVIAAARLAYCDDFIQELPEGYNTLVGERGVRLSGGQRQRLGIARAFLKDAPILILDEATSALDTQSELEIQLALANLIRGRTVIAIAHRLSTVIGLDRVVVLADGKIVEDGAPATLRRAGGVFQKLWQLQAEGFEDESVSTQPIPPRIHVAK